MGKIEHGSMTGTGTSDIRRKSILGKEWRITKDTIKRFIGLKIPDISKDHPYPVGKRTIVNVPTSLDERILVDFHCHHLTVRGTLGCHQSNKSGAGADVQNATGIPNPSPGT